MSEVKEKLIDVAEQQELTCLMMDFSLAMAMTVTHTDMRDPRKSQNCRTSYSMMQKTTMPGWSHAW